MGFGGIWMGGFVKLRRHPEASSLSKAFQKQTKFAFGFFNTHLLTRASS